MYQPGMDQGLARIQHAEMLEDAARQRAEDKSQPGQHRASALRLALALAAAAPVAAVMVLLLAAH
jgi:hypothetical protein